ncbi:response regulator [Telluribacter sp.]|jgi:PAS domain S-box-containing protein|uniref:response regulator n=1 Tax=Telluribacter sp. TaxID=1978767 RepID=UPI002E0F5001|nr:response regulator [Telluribacter sp.]
MLPVPANEFQRLRALKSYKILDTPAEPEFDRLTQLASVLCKVPVSLISLVDEERSWFKSKQGLDFSHTNRSQSFCQYTISGSGLFEVEDTTQDERFRELPMVTGTSGVRFYAGCPVVDPLGNVLGTLAVMDQKPNKLSDDQRVALQLLAQEVAGHIVARKERKILKTYEALFARAVDMVCVAGLDGTFREVNTGFTQQLGWESTEMMNHRVYEFTHPDDVELTFTEIEKLSGEAKTVHFTNRFQTKNGDYKILKWVATADTVPDQIYAVVRDISYFMKDLDYPAGESFPQSTDEGPGDEPGGWMASLEEFTGSSHNSNLLSVIGNENPQFAWLNTNSLVESLLGAPAVGPTTEVTRQPGGAPKRVTVNRPGGAASVQPASDKFNAVANSVNQDTEWFESSVTARTPSENFLSVMNDIFHIATQPNLNEDTPFETRKLIRSVTTLLGYKAAEKGLELGHSIHESVPNVLTGNPASLKRILLKLVHNALKYNKSGKVKLHVKKVQETDTECYIQFSLADSGIVIPISELKDVLKRFAKTDSQIALKYQTKSRQLDTASIGIEFKRGTVHLENDGEGISFGFTLPFQKTTQVLPETTTKLIDNQTIKVLLVEDNRLNQEVSLKLLSNFGFITDLAENGKAAVEKVKCNSYDLILMDLQIPEMNGFEASEYIRQQLNVKTPIIALTAHGVFEDDHNIYSSGMNDFLTKPFSSRDLYNKITQFSAIGKALPSFDDETTMVESIIDLSYLKNFSEGSAEFEREMIELYITKTPPEMDLLENSVVEGDYELIRKKAHTLSSSFSMMGVKEQGLLKLIEEQAIATIEKDTILANFNRLKSIFQKSLVILRNELEK